MARTTLTPLTAPGGYDTDGAALTWTAADASNLNQFVMTGNDLVLVYNSSGDTAYDVTLTSVADRLGRTGNLTFELPAGAYRMFGPMPLEGWQQTGANAGKFFLEAENAAVKFAIIRLP